MVKHTHQKPRPTGTGFFNFFAFQKICQKPFDLLVCFYCPISGGFIFANGENK
jgi:hypothetical protein